jgi:hypothetical protein
MNSKYLGALEEAAGPLGNVRFQGATLAAMARVGLDALVGSRARRGGDLAGFAPGPRHRAMLPPPDPGLVRDFVRYLGGEAALWRTEVPPLLFPQWTFPLLAKTLAPLPIPAHRLLNGGFSLDTSGPLPAGEALEVEAQLVAIEEGPRKTTFVQEVVTGTASSPAALRVRFFPVLPRRGGAAGSAGTGAAGQDAAEPTSRSDVGPLPAIPPEGAREVARLGLSRRAGLDFAALTGDFNPIHWLPPVARASGFRDVILHGFASFGMALGRLVDAELGGDPRRVTRVAARFNQPLVLPAEAVVLSDGEGGVWLGPGLGQKSWVSGRVTAVS